MAERFLYHPFRVGTHGGVAVTDDPDRHLRDKIEAVLFTAPGERVNQPDFGAGLNRIVFDTLDELTITALEFRVSQALRRDVGDELVIDSVDFETRPESGELILNLSFRRREDQKPRGLEIKL
jgi:hypothetical protein